MDDIEEYKALTAVFLAYHDFYKWEYDQLIKPRNIKFNSLTSDEQLLLPWYQAHTDHLKQCIEKNKQFTQMIALTICQSFGIEPNPLMWYEASHEDFDRVRSVLLQLMREWSDEGKVEREKSFDFIMTKLNHQYPDIESRPKVEVLVPGCGLGRIIFQLVLNGYKVQGNEFSYHMLIMSNFILNYCHTQHEIFPFLHKLSNVESRATQLRPVIVPDTLDALSKAAQKHPNIPFMDLMSMSAGSFTDLYGPDTLLSNKSSPNSFRTTNQAKFNTVITCFFIDTAANIIEYLKTIDYSLTPNGQWYNLGPLLWHYESDFNVTYIDSEESQIILTNKGLELSREDLLDLIGSFGFKFIEKQLGISTVYSSDPRLLLNFVYNCEFWVCEKP